MVSCKAFNRSAALVLAFALGAMLAQPAPASTTRMNSLGGSADYFEDESNVGRWYGSLADYPNRVLMDSGHFNVRDGYRDRKDRKLSGPSAGLHIRFDEQGTWGTAGLYFHAQSDDSDPGSLHRGYLGESFRGSYCLPLGPVQLGLMVRHTADTRQSGVQEEQLSLAYGFDRSRTDLGLGLRFDVGERAYLDLAGDVRNIQDQAWGSDPVDADWSTDSFDSWDNYGLRARGFVGLGHHWALAPLLEYLSETFTDTRLADQSLYRESSANDGRMIRLGTALNYFPDPDRFFLVSAEFMNGTNDHRLYDLDGNPTAIWQEDYQAVNLRIGYETRVAYWITLRAATGFEHVDNRGTVDRPRSGGDIPLALGVGLNFNTLALDLALSDREPRGLSRYSPALSGSADATWLSLTLGFEY